MEERLKRIKVTVDNLVTVAFFSRNGSDIEGLTEVTEAWKEKVRNGLFKVSEIDRVYSHWTYVFPGTNKELPVWFHKVKNDDIYDLEVLIRSEGVDEQRRVGELNRFLVPVRKLEDGKLESVNKITLNLLVNGEIVKHRLYFTLDESDIWDYNRNELAALMNGSKDVVWIEYTV